jgi:oligoribonuclease
MSEKQNDLIVWIDCEMTGLDIEKDALIEIAVLVTDGSLNILGDGVDLVIKPPQAALDQMVEIVRTMHTSSGLLDELENGITLQEAETLVMEYIRKFVPDARKAPLAGNSIGTDRAFIARDLKALEVHLHYRVIDVSSITR